MKAIIEANQFVDKRHHSGGGGCGGGRLHNFTVQYYMIIAYRLIKSKLLV